MNKKSNSPIIEARQLTKSFKLDDVTTKILDNMSLQVNKGEFVSVMGQSGAGKSTLLYILGGLDKPTKGSVFLNGRDIAQFDDSNMSQLRRRNIGFIFQFYNLIPNLSVEENIMLPLLLDGKKISECKQSLADILDKVGLTKHKKHTPRELSGGQQQRVAIARALIAKPEILFADEPTGNLDSQTSEEIMKLLQQINTSTNQTIIMVTHSTEASRYCDRQIIVRDGVIQEGD